MKKLVPSVMFAAFVACGVVACSGADGEDGAQGPAGLTGTAGTNGVDGKNGLDGVNGETGPGGEVGPAGPIKPLRLLDCKQPGWRDEARAAINKMITEKGIASPTYDPAQPPVAVFDWDNTVVKNDIGDATFFWMIANNKIRRPADWKATNAALTDAAATALTTACGTADVGEPMDTKTLTSCAAEIARIYDNGTTVAGAAAWTNPVTTKINQQYAWVAQLTAGYTPSEVRGFAREAFEENVNNAVGTKQPFGTYEYNYWLRVYTQMDDLIGALKDNGFDVWILTASPQLFVEAISNHVGIDPDHVVGIRNVVTNGKVTYGLQACGGVTAGSLITFDEGKRCWINKVVYGETDPAKQLAVNVASKRPVFVAGDSDTDIAMLKDATALKLVVNRGKMQTVCNAYESLEKADGRWFVQPMFINPNAKKSDFGCAAANIPGTTEKIVNESGAVFTKSYEDKVFELGPASTCK